MIGACCRAVGQTVGATGESPKDDRQDGTVSEFFVNPKSCHDINAETELTRRGICETGCR